MQGLRDPSFFPTKENPAPAGDEEGRIRPAFNEDSIYSVMATLSGPEIEYSLPLGIEGGAWDQLNGAIIGSVRGKRSSLTFAENFS